MIKARDLTKRLGAVKALTSVDIDIETGETVVIFGANGAGKTTLLRLIAGLARPSTGWVQIDGAEPKRCRSRIGYLGHECYLYPYLTPAENLEFYGRLYRLNPKVTAGALDRVLMSAKKDVPVNKLSAGELQRVGLARALLQDPDYLLLDEPLSNLDEESSDAVPSIIKRQGRTIVMATHDLARGQAIADRTLLLEAGRLCIAPNGSPRD